jgi:hypothetical protein
VLTWAGHQRVVCAAGTKLLAYCWWQESRPTKWRVDVKQWAFGTLVLLSYPYIYSDSHLCADYHIVHKQG